jgi:hypothetical protein
MGEPPYPAGLVRFRQAPAHRGWQYGPNRRYSGNSSKLA